MESLEVVHAYRFEQLKARAQPFMGFIDSCIRSVQGSAHDALHPFANNASNLVFRTETANQPSLIVRVHIGEPGWFEQERIAIDLAREQDVPVPRVLSIDHSSSANDFVSVCIQASLPGRPLRALINEGTIAHVDAVRVTREAGAFLRRIHSVEPSGFRGNQVDRLSFDRDAIRISEVAGGETEALTPEERAAIDELFEYLAVTTPAASHDALVHGDFDSKHILVSGEPGHEAVTGVIDWEEARAGDALFDYGRWSFWDAHPNIQHLYDGTLESHYGPDASTRLMHATAEAALGAIWWEMHHLGFVVRRTLDLVVDQRK